MRLVLLATAAFALGVIVTASPDGRAADPPSTLACVQSRGEARYLGFAYDHWVHLTSSCERPVSCRVVTNRNPEPIDARVAPKKTESVLTYRASTTALFTFKVQCELANHND